MSELFVAADELSNDPDDKGATRAHRRRAPGRRPAPARPFGTDPGWWDGVVARAGALADLVETPNADPEHIVELATAVRAELRPVHLSWPAGPPHSVASAGDPGRAGGVPLAADRADAAGMKAMCKLTSSSWAIICLGTPLIFLHYTL